MQRQRPQQNQTSIDGILQANTAFTFHWTNVKVKVVVLGSEKGIIPLIAPDLGEEGMSK